MATIFAKVLQMVISIKVAEPQFEGGQNKNKLGNNEVMGSVEVAVRCFG